MELFNSLHFNLASRYSAWSGGQICYAPQEAGQLDRLRLMVHLFHCQSCCHSLSLGWLPLIYFTTGKRNQTETGGGLNTVYSFFLVYKQKAPLIYCFWSFTSTLWQELLFLPLKLSIKICRHYTAQRSDKTTVTPGTTWASHYKWTLTHWQS